MDADSFQLRIETLSYGGRGVGRHEDGRVVFVPRVIPGELVRVAPLKYHLAYIDAETLEVIEPSPERVAPVCEHFAVCGGCDWQHLPYALQLEWKQRILLQEVEKLCAVRPDDIPAPVGVDEAYAYRSHARIQCRYDPTLKSGFFMKKSRDIVAFEACPILNPRIQETLDHLRSILGRQRMYGLYSLEIHAPSDDILVLGRCRGTMRDGDLKAMNTIFRELSISGLSFVMLGPPRRDYVLGQRACRYEVTSRGITSHLTSGLGGFIQANLKINDAMVGHVMNLVEGSARILELYSGCGNFSIPIAPVAGEVTAIERDGRLVTQGRMNCKRNRAANVRFLRMEALKAVQSILNESVHFDTVLLDPPREGAKEIMQDLPRIEAERIVYVSCNPTTLARDLKPLLAAGYTLASLRLFDMFPQTYHIECIADLKR